MALHRRPYAAFLAALLAAGCGQTPSDDRPPARDKAAPAKKQAPFTLLASGDVLPHDSVIQQALADGGGETYDFAPMLAGVKPAVSRADLALCHMETVYGPDGGPFTGYPYFKSPPQVAKGAADTGYDGCSTASNHSLDLGAEGIMNTLDAMDTAGLKHAGTGRSKKEAESPALLKVKGAKVAQLSYTYDTNDIPMPRGKPWAVNITEPDRIIADARAARRAGADVVAVSIQWGTEWEEAPDRTQLRLARELTKAGVIDVILGTHNHVPQAYEKVNGTWVVYGMGDQIAGSMTNYSGESDPRGNWSSIARFTFAPPRKGGERWRVSKAEFVPQLMDTGSMRVRNLGANPEGYEDVRDRIRETVLSRGAAKDGLTMGK
ncbi:CapA family protein [Streptomyces sp. A7024]|uniref:CapA family protein n=1 Tax=Streptomyces coryli TaxID=1128680 RepID=A0A6G4U5W7_9ACTN|nr:CapA family protein [Streptomyces coryli]NGN67130.1 CapA family protein [Streptomyces coryli]